ncbi:DUF2167 domain-containing protein [Mitsuaria sp. WAJ17]|uniref:DUF2167 domain-containing protein n=1 Tax=Mitsuaria sp. WAJ17 TaxID=2761452 RepID=UPI001600B37B|nr:DUF2167 domain-containing protein [Mitsuaria sp. WAJ17]MBB2487216.1 DUF2167 domain-containing protein [Mitsuaria sp. WAJ17]
MNKNFWRRLAAACLLSLPLALLGRPALADEAPDPSAQVFAEAKQAATAGPSDVTLANQAVLHLPAGKVFIPQPHAAKLMRAMGNPGDYSDLLGLVFPEGGEEGWFAVLRFEGAGYIKDDDARDWNADDLLKSYREGTEASNAERAKMGEPELEIVGWAEKPTYAADSHRLVWAMSSRSKGAPAEEEQGVNYNTYVLGREGYLSLNLVTGLKELGAHKEQARTLLGALDFNEGKRYADFNSSTDKVAEYGLAALVLGVGAKKLGFFAVIFAFLAKFAKLAILAVLGFGGAILKFFKRKPKEEAVAVETHQDTLPMPRPEGGKAAE